MTKSNITTRDITHRQIANNRNVIEYWNSTFAKKDAISLYKLPNDCSNSPLEDDKERTNLYPFKIAFEDKVSLPCKSNATYAHL